MTVNPPAGYLPPPQPFAQPERPSTVSIATLLLYLLAALQVIGAIVTVVAMSGIKDEIVDIYVDGGMERDLAETAGNVYSITIYATLGISVLLAVLLLVCAIFVGKGKQWARITTWVVGGLLLCCVSFGLIGNSVGGGFGGGTSGGVDQAEIQRRIEEAMPSWATPVSLAMGAIQLLAVLAVIILLALPPSHPFFRKQEAAWVPPTYPTA